MKKDPRRICLSILNRLISNSPFSDQLLKSYLNRSDLDERDRAFVVNIVQDFIRWKLRIDWIIKQFIKSPFKRLEPYVLNVLRIAVYQIYFMDKVPEFAIVNEAVNQAKRKGKYIANTVNGILRNICRNKGKINYPDKEKDPIGFLSTYFSFPEWLVKKWIDEIGYKETEKLLNALNETPNIVIRTNLLKISRDDLVKRLRQKGMEAYATKYSPSGIIIKRLHRDVSDMEEYKEGLFFVQDEASQICAYILDPRPDEIILDACSGLGVKAIQMVELIKKGKIISLDINPKRLLILAQTLKKEDMEDIVFPIAGDGCSAFSLFKCKFDKILIDAPCSGLGTIRRHPDIKWTKKEEDIKMLSDLQKRLLDGVSPCLKKNGRMIYVTCTISKEENEEVVEEFLKRHPEFSLLDISKEFPWLKELVNENGFLRTYPHIHDMDGFFCALFEREE